jgi:hypothetical protein
MSEKEKDIVDLIPSEDGVYSTKDTRHLTTVKKKVSKEKEVKKTYKNMDDFFEGVDAGLDFLEGMDKRLKRILKLR